MAPEPTQALQTSFDVVVVEDSEDDARMTLLGLRAVIPPPSVHLIVDGESAREQLAGEHLPTQLVFLDLKLPRVHGLDVLAAMREDPKTSATPVVVFTSSDEPSDVNRAKELGCAEFLTKPIDWTDYIRLVCVTACRFLPQRNCGA